MSLTKQFEWQHEDGHGRVLTMPVEPTTFEVHDTADVGRNFTNSGYVENNVFASYMIVELVFDFMTKSNFFINLPHDTAHASIQHFFQYIKKGSPFGFTWDYNYKREMALTHLPEVGTQLIYVGQTLNANEYIYITNSRGDHEVFRVLTDGGIYPVPATIYPTMSLQYYIGDAVRDWPYFPALSYLGGSLNESWDGSKLYYSMSIKARTINT